MENRKSTLESLRLKAFRLISAFNVIWLPILGYTAYHYESGYKSLYVAVFLVFISFLIGVRRPTHFLSYAVSSITMILLISLQVYLTGYGKFQLDFHMYYFSMLAILMLFMDWRLIVVAAGTIAVHHLSLNFLLPYAIFPDGADFSRVVMHAIAVVIEATVLVWLAYTVEKLLNRMSNSTHDIVMAIEDTDLSIRFDESGRDDSAIFTAALNRFVSHICETLLLTKGCVGHVERASSRLKAATVRLKEMSHAQESGIMELQREMQTTGEQISQVNILAESSSQKTALVRQASLDASDLMSSLTGASQKIASVTSVVLKISEQINLLSLNASIEAARAGEAGRGFAVVAGEVKKLADETNNSISEIHNVVNELNVTVSKARSSVEGIVGSVDDVNDTISQVYSSLEQQSQSVEEVLRAVEVFAGQIMEVNKIVGESVEFVNEMESNSHAVTEQIGKFKLS